VTSYRPSSRPGGRPGGRGRFAPRRKVCSFCVDKIKIIDYKDTAKLSRYISERGKIEPRRKTGTCARHQRALAMAIKRARLIAILPFIAEHSRVPSPLATPLKPEAKPEAAKPETKPEVVKAEVEAPKEEAAASAFEAIAEKPEAKNEETADSGEEQAESK